MKRCLLVVTAVVSVVQMAIAIAAAPERHIVTTNGALACKEKEDFDRVMFYVARNDIATANKEVDSLRASGACSLFNAGDEIVIVEASQATLSIKIRHVGASTGYWTTKSFIK